MGFLDRLVGRRSNTAPALKLNACLVHAGGLLGIVGESYRQDELQSLSHRTTDASRFRADLAAYAAEVADEEPDRRWFLAVLVREPDNPKDPEAVAVHAEGGGKLGYLKREDARRYAPVFRSLEKRGYDAAACPAMLNGGGDKSFGVVLALSAPGPVLNDLTSSDPQPLSAEDVLRDLELPATVIGCKVDRGPGPAFDIESKGPLGSDQGTLFLAQGDTPPQVGSPDLNQLRIKQLASR